jgi:hypothetical protein
MTTSQFDSDKRHAVLSGMTDGGAVEYAERLQQHPSRGGQIQAALDRASRIGSLAAWASVHELGAVHIQHRRNFSTTESLFAVVLTARDSLDLESGWFATVDEALAAAVDGLKPLEPEKGEQKP